MLDVKMASLMTTCRCFACIQVSARQDVVHQASGLGGVQGQGPPTPALAFALDLAFALASAFALALAWIGS
jgi:hypothetical protein